MDRLYGPSGVFATVAGTENAIPKIRMIDHLGSLTGIFDPQSGQFNEANSLAYGESNLNATNDNFTFTDHERDAENGSDATLFRHYSPEQGRWLSADPYSGSLDLSDPQSFNRYAYLSNRPLAAVDQYGLCGDDGVDDCGDSGSSGGDNSEVSDAGGSDSSNLGGNDASGVSFGEDGSASASAFLSYDSSGLALSAQASSDAAFSGVGTFFDLLGNVSGPVGAFANGANGIIQLSQGNPGQAALYFGGAAASALLIPGGSSIAKSARVFIFLRNAEELREGQSLIRNSSNAIGATGQLGETALKQLGGVSQQYFPTSLGARYIDQFVGGAAHESKVGYTSLSSHVQLQIRKDIELINDEVINSSTWHFFKSPVTGRVGPSQPLLNELQKNGIGVIVH